MLLLERISRLVLVPLQHEQSSFRNSVNKYLGFFYTYQSASLLMIDKENSHNFRDLQAGFAAVRKMIKLSNRTTDPSNLAKPLISHTFLAEKNKCLAKEGLYLVGINH